MKESGLYGAGFLKNGAYACARARVWSAYAAGVAEVRDADGDKMDGCGRLWTVMIEGSY